MTQIQSKIQIASETDTIPEQFTHYKIIKSVLIFTVVGVLLYGSATLISDYRVIIGALAHFPIGSLFLVIILVIFGWILRGWRFHYYLLNTGVKVAFWYSLEVFLSGFSLTGTPGKIGEAVKGLFLKRDHGTPMSEVMGIVMIERLMDLWGMLILAACSLLLFTDYYQLFVVCAVAIIGGGAVLSLEKLYRPILSWTSRIRFLHWISEKILQILLTGRELMKPRIFVVGLITSTVAWGAEAVSLYIIMKGLSLSVSFLEANFIYSFSTLIGALSMLPGGIGGTEAGMLGLMRFLGISYNAGLPAVILIRVCTLWLAIFVGIGFMLALLARSTDHS